MKVVGVTGTVGAGKNVFKDELMKKRSCDYVSLSTLIMEETIKKRGLQVNLFSKADLADEMRRKYGSDVLAKTAWNFMQRRKEILIVDGIRNPGEAEFLKKTNGRDFVFVAVDAPREIRFQRVVQRNDAIDPKEMEEFIRADEREQGLNEPEYGLQVRKCIEMADYVLINDGSVEDFVKKCDEVIAKI